jgi:hypothetical protein
VTFSRLYSDFVNQEITVSEAFSIGIRNFRFRRVVVQQRKEQWLRMCGVRGDVTLSEGSDKLYWKLSNTGVLL